MKSCRDSRQPKAPAILGQNKRGISNTYIFDIIPLLAPLITEPKNIIFLYRRRIVLRRRVKVFTRCKSKSDISFQLFFPPSSLFRPYALISRISIRR